MPVESLRRTCAWSSVVFLNFGINMTTYIILILSVWFSAVLSWCSYFTFLTQNIAMILILELFVSRYANTIITYIYIYIFIYLFLKCDLWALGLVKVFSVEIKNQNKKEKSESNDDLKKSGYHALWRAWDSGLQGQHIPTVGSLKWDIPATRYDWIQHWYKSGVTP